MIVDNPNSRNSQINTLLVPLLFDSEVDVTLKATANIFVPYRTRHIIFHSVACYMKDYLNNDEVPVDERLENVTEYMLFLAESPCILMTDLFSGSMSPVAFCQDNQVITSYTSILVPDSARKDIRSTYTFQLCGLDGVPFTIPERATSVELLRVDANNAANDANGVLGRAAYRPHMIAHVVVQIEFRE
jgi:hypothetical protein